MSCYGCQKRHMNCHADCEDYSQEREKEREKKERIKEAKRREQIFAETTIQGQNNRRKSHAGKPLRSRVKSKEM